MRKGAVILVVLSIVSIGVLVRVALGSSDGYPLHSGIVATVFSYNEDATADNAGISNAQSFWDSDWRQHGPLENQYYVALPYADYLEDGTFNPDNVRIPWRDPAIAKGASALKNRWIEVRCTDGAKTRVAFGQWEDVGPSDKTDARELSDPNYVFGSARPKNTFDLKAGIDLSPTLAKALGIAETGSGTVSWRFIAFKDVPSGPWTKVLTTRPPNQW